MTSESSQKQLLVVGYVWPEPASSAAGRYMLDLLRTFRDSGWQVMFSTPAKTTDFMIDLSKEAIQTQVIELNDESFDRFVAELQPDAVLFDRFMMEEQFGWRVEKNCPNAIKILDTEDLQCLRYARQLVCKTDPEQHFQFSDMEFVKAHLSFNTDIAKREIAAIYRCDLSLIISEFEKTLLIQHFGVPESILQYLPFTVSQQSFYSHSPSFDERQHFMMIGNFRHAPNWDSVLYCRELWPKIREAIPGAECHIYGAYTPPKATALNNTKLGFIIKDRAEDALSTMATSRVLLAPLRFGAGIKGKLFDAFITQTPSITTPIGSEGMVNSHDEWPGAVATSDDEFIQQAISLYRSERVWLQAQQRIDHNLKNRYCETQRDALVARVNQVMAQLDSHRSANFTGQMLRHHTLQSTRYLSRYIETKTKLLHQGSNS